MITAAAMERLGTESAFAVLARATELAQQGRDVINLGIGQPDFSTPEHIVEAGIKALQDGHHGYTPAAGLPALREAVAADLLSRLKVEVSPEQVIIVPGGKVTMNFAVLMFGEPGAELLYPDPGFPIYRSLIEYSGAKAVPFPLTEDWGFAFSAEDLLSRLTPASRLIVLNSPANPTGGVTPKVEVDKLVAGLADFPNVAILSDEIYSQMLYDGQDHVSLLHYPEIRDRVILLDGWSKTYAMTGWRLGFGVWPKPLVDGAERLAINAHSCVNAPTQFAGIAALEGPQAPVSEMIEAFERRRAVTVEALNALPGVTCLNPGGAFYCFPNITGTGMTAKEMETSLLEEAGVATLSGTSFGALGEGYIRVSYANSRDNIRRAMDRIGSFLAARASQG